MKKAIAIFIVFMSLSTITTKAVDDKGVSAAISYYGEYCDGWEDGWKAGYCYGSGYTNCLSPLPPICPIQRIGESTYKDGYNRGFLQGIVDRK